MLIKFKKNDNLYPTVYVHVPLYSVNLHLVSLKEFQRRELWWRRISVRKGYKETHEYCRVNGSVDGKKGSKFDVVFTGRSVSTGPTTPTVDEQRVGSPTPPICLSSVHCRCCVKDRSVSTKESKFMCRCLPFFYSKVDEKSRPYLST